MLLYLLWVELKPFYFTKNSVVTYLTDSRPFSYNIYKHWNLGGGGDTVQEHGWLNYHQSGQLL